MRPPIAVGIDGFPASPPAAHWAAREALLRDLPLRVVHAWVLLSPTAPDVPDAPDAPREADQNYWARRLVTDTVAELRAAHPGLRVTAELVPQETAPALLTAGRDAEMLVLGSRGLGTVGGFLLGSVGRHVLARGVRPMVLVHADTDTDTDTDRRADGRERGADVAVGLSLRRPCDEVLDFAFDAAARRGGTVRAVHAPHRRARQAEDGARAALDATLRPWREKYPGVPVTGHLAPDGATRAVVRAAADCGLLVLGREAGGGSTVPRLGPVAHAALHHVPGPVAVVPYR